MAAIRPYRRQTVAVASVMVGYAGPTTPVRCRATTTNTTTTTTAMSQTGGPLRPAGLGSFSERVGMTVSFQPTSRRAMSRDPARPASAAYAASRTTPSAGAMRLSAIWLWMAPATAPALASGAYFPAVG